MEKNLDYYLSLPYKIEVIPIPEEEGGGYCARLPQFGVLGIVGDGETIEEALRDLEEAKRLRFDGYIREGLEIPEPEME
jgi:predicted RNase H-like HicB family nuclease